MFDLIAMSSEPREIGLFLSPNINGSHSFFKYSLYAIIKFAYADKAEVSSVYLEEEDRIAMAFFFFLSLF